MDQIALLAPALVLLVTALGILVLDISLRENAKRIIPFIAIGGVIASLVLTAAVWGTDITVLHVFKFDSLSTFSNAFILITMIGLIFISFGYLPNVSDNTPFYYALLLGNGLAALLLSSTTNILMLMLSLEFLSITSYVLTGFLHYNTRSTEAAIKYLIYGAVISALMFYGVSWLYGLTGQTDYELIASALKEPGMWFSGQSFPDTLLIPILIFISAGFAFKIAAAPFHQWAPDAYEGSPTPVTAMLATIPKIAGFVVLTRVAVLLFPTTTTLGAIWHSPLLAVFSAAAMLLGSLGGLWQTDVKRMMAYSGITQAGYALMGLAIGSVKGMEATFIYLTAYVIAELGIFATIAVITSRFDLTDLAEYIGLYHRSPLLAVIMIISLLSLTGLPGTVGFVGKFTLFSACLDSGYLWLILVAMVSTIISFGYYWKLIRVMWLETAEALPGIKINTASLPVLLFSIVGTMGIGLFPSYLLQVVKLVFESFR